MSLYMGYLTTKYSLLNTIPHQLNPTVISRFDIFDYSFQLLDNDNREIYSELMFGKWFDCYSSQVLRGNKKKGCKIVISDLNIVFPDGTIKEIKVDTIFLGG